MFYGIIVGSILGIIVGTVVGLAICDASYHFDKLKGIIGFILTCAIIAVPISILGKYMNITGTESYIAQYKITKTTYVESIKNQSIGGMERIKLVDSIATVNQQLADRKANIDKIWNFDVPQNLKNEIKVLEYIDIKE